jgi:hypothetical protein
MVNLQKIESDYMEQIAKSARLTRERVELAGVSLNPFKCANCNQIVRYWVIGDEIRPAAANVLGAVCRKSDTGWHSA